MKKIKYKMNASMRNLLVVALIATLFLVNFSQIIVAENKTHDIYENVSDALSANDITKKTEPSGKYLFNNFTDEPKKIIDPFATLNKKNKLNGDHSSILQRRDTKNNLLTSSHFKSAPLDRKNKLNGDTSPVIQKLINKNKLSDLAKINNKRFLNRITNNIFNISHHLKPDEVYDSLTSYDKDGSPLAPRGGNLGMEDPIVCGYLTDDDTDDPIGDVEVWLWWDDYEGNSSWNSTLTDSEGFYSINVAAAGYIYLNLSAQGYYDYYDDEYIDEFQTLWLNISLVHYPENSIVCGYVTDDDTDDPIEGANVELYWYDGHYSNWNTTLTDSEGFYSINVAAGDIYLYFSAQRYYDCYDYYYIYVGEFQTQWLNISLVHLPENSVVCGYVTDDDTDDPIEGAEVYLDWYDGDYYNWNTTLTDSEGFYSMNVAAGEIELYFSAPGYYDESTDYYSIGEFETLWFNASLYPIPPENSLVCGYVTDNSTGDPIEGAWVDLYWQDSQGHDNWNDTSTDSEGFYSMNVAAGYVELYFWASEYLDESTDYYSIGESETKWLNASLYPIPPENSLVCGYVTNIDTGAPIEGAWVYLSWQDNQGHDNSNDTSTDSDGFYSMNVAAGEIYLEASYNGAYTDTDLFNIEDYQTIWTNFSLDITAPTISNLTIPDYVWTDHPGDIGATVGDRNLNAVMMYLIDSTGNTFNQYTAIWLYTNYSGVNSTYLFEDYNGTFASLEQDENSTNATFFVLSNSTLNDKLCIFAEFKKNQTSSWEMILMEYNRSTGLLANIGIPQVSPNGSLYLEYINDIIEPGISVVIPLMLNLSEGWIPADPNTNFTLYGIGDSNNPTLGWHPLNSGIYYGYIQVADKSNNNNLSSFVLFVTNHPYYISGNIYYDGNQTEPIYVWLLLENVSQPIREIVLPSSGGYEFTVINGTYFVLALMDINGNEYPDVEYEPIGWAINKTILEEYDLIVIDGSNMSDINITLFMAISGAVYYDGELSGDIYIMAFDQPPELTEELMPATNTSISWPGEYWLFVPSGTYYIFGFMDVNSNMTPDLGIEPFGYAINNTLLQGADPIIIDGIGEDGIDLTFWLVEASEGNQTYSGENILEPAGMNITVVINTSAPTNVSFVSYANNPHPVNPPPNSLNKFIEITVENLSVVNWPVNITIYYTQTDLDAVGTTEDKLLGIHFWNDTANEWQLYNDTGVNTSYDQDGYEGYFWANVWHFTLILPGGDNIPPSKVTGLTVTDAKDGKLNLAWTVATDNVAVDHYKIYRDGSFLINRTTTSYQDTGLTNEHPYIYQVSAVDTSGNEGEKSDSNSGTPTASSGGNPPELPPGDGGITNHPPVANLSAGEPYVGFIGIPVTFDGSLSNDSDGNITKWFWNFGEGTNGSGEIVTHIYSIVGTYTVTLTVTDNDNATDSDTTTVVIRVQNKAPSNPTIDGPATGNKNVNCSYTVLSTDANNDTIKYTFDWGDGTTESSKFLPNGTSCTRNHSWTKAGKYTIKVTATDNQANSPSEKIILIDAVDVGNIGYLTDDDGDGTYDVFHSNDELVRTSVEKQTDGTYLIDSDGNGKTDCTYDPVSKEVKPYGEKKPSKEFPWLLAIIGIIIAILVIIAILYFTGYIHVEKEHINEQPSEGEKPKEQQSKEQLSEEQQFDNFKN
ncbi:MAG: carboxypeptidase regulatory-like domain-containing protein [Euryarchaeota archaeon]|nr:carboxypeptidase regulatory-like domain-containing protein [Euryarchaeota archaeon]